MSRSHKKRLYGNYYLCESDKKYKRRAHRRERRVVRQLLHIDSTDEQLPSSKSFGDADEAGKGQKQYVPGLQLKGWNFSRKELLRWVRK
jgi:hypothetical protein